MFLILVPFPLHVKPSVDIFIYSNCKSKETKIYKYFFPIINFFLCPKSS